MDLMPRCYTSINFQQVQNQTLRNPLLQLSFNFVSSFEAEDSWADQTIKATITFPMNMYAYDPSTKQTISLGGSSNPDKWVNNLFNKGDAVTFNFGYYRYDTTGREILDIPSTPVFSGYISKVNSKKPIVLELEDNMWLLKQIPCTPQVWPSTQPIENLLTNLLQGTGFNVNALTDTTIPDLEIQNISVAQLLEKLRNEYHLEAYFRGNQLRIGSQVYIEAEAVTSTFVFQQNIISDELTFQRLNDLKLSIVCESLNEQLTGGANKNGQQKSEQQRLSVLVYPDSKGAWKYMKQNGDTPFPENSEGERRTLNFNNITNAATLAQRGLDELAKYYYTGFKGKFTTFAVPCVKQGDNVNIIDPVLPDRNGVYKVRSVKYSGGISGHRQVIELDYKLYVVNNTITTPPPLQLASS